MKPIFRNIKALLFIFFTYPLHPNILQCCGLPLAEPACTSVPKMRSDVGQFSDALNFCSALESHHESPTAAFAVISKSELAPMTCLLFSEILNE